LAKLFGMIFIDVILYYETSYYIFSFLRERLLAKCM